VILLRHASAGDRDRWESHDDHRPLDSRGYEQSAALVKSLADYEIDRILTSPSRRCVDTVRPLAEARQLELELREELGEDLHTEAGHDLVRALAGTAVLFCGHGGLEDALVDPPRWRKGDAFIVDAQLRVIATIS
jgi:phosphohistidine phosphatase SixA